MKNETIHVERVNFWNSIQAAGDGVMGIPAPASIARGVADAMRAYSAMRRVSTVITTLTGGPMTWPNSDGRTEEGEQVDVNAPAQALDTGFGSTPLTVFKYSSKILKVPVELLQDAGIDFPLFMDARIGARIGRITNRKLTMGVGGATEPMGIVTAAAPGKIGATGQSASLVYDDLEDLVSSVDDAYRQSPKCGWMMHEQTLRFIKKMKNAQGHPLKLVSRGVDMQEHLLDYPAVVNNDMPVMSANAKSILFGDFSTYVIRDALETEVKKLTDSALLLNGQIGFIGFARCGGGYIDVGGAIKAYQNSAT